MKVQNFIAILVATSLSVPITSYSAEPGRYEGPIFVDTSSDDFSRSIEGLENPEGLVNAIRDLQAKQAKPSGASTQASGSVSCTGGSGGWSCTGGISWEFGGQGTPALMSLTSPPPMDPPPTFPDPVMPGPAANITPADVVFAAQSVYDSHPQSKVSPEALMTLGIFSGACWVSLGATRQCFDNFTASMCENVGRTTGGIVTFVPLGSC